MKKIVTTLASMFLSICISVSATAAEPNQYTSSSTYEKIKEIQAAAALQKNAVSAHELFEDNLLINDEGRFIYPESYAGEYIDNAGNLVIQTATTDHSDYVYLQKAYSCVKFEKVKYSKEYLDGLINEYIATYDKDAETFYRAYIDTEQNCAVIEVDEATLSLRSKDYAGLPLVFKLGTPFKLCSTTVYGGDKITNKKSIFSGSHMTAGIGAINKSGGDAIITCGHDMAVEDKIYLGSTRIGTVTYVSYGNNSLGDFSVVTLIDGNKSSDIVREGENGAAFYNYGTHNAVTNEILFQYTENGGSSSYSVTYTDVSTNYNGIITRGQSVADIILGSVKLGDSGAGLFWRDSSNSRKSFCGVLAGLNDEERFITFTPVSSILPYIRTIKSN